MLTAEWVHQLKDIEHGGLEPEVFDNGITIMLRDLVKTYTAIKGAEVLFPSGLSVVGSCPRCCGDVTESKNGFFCETGACHFVLWRDNKFFSAKKMTLSKNIAATLIKDGRVKVSRLYSERTSKTYDATIVMDDTGEHINFKLEFDSVAKNRGCRER